ncbi:MAG: hypothetical protein MI863_05225, partial [Desulfobacterales bacterium]|nr:hypothetical protein [Desulfobacterales bacterium]
YVENNGKFPVVLGFKQPEVSQLSFSDSAGKNHKLERHESDRYSRILGDTVSENGGEDVSGEEELRFPDHSYFKVVPTGGSRDLADLSQLTRDSDEIPFQLKREGGKEFFFQHSSGTRVLIGRDGEFKISHQAGTWVSIGPDTGDLPLAAACGRTIDSKNDPPAEPDCSAVQVHIGHSSGTSVTIDAGGNITAKSTGSVHVNSSDITLGAGTAYKLLDERSHTYLGSLVASLNTWLNNHTHGENDAGGSTDTPDQTAALSSPPDIKEAATSHTVAS